MDRNFKGTLIGGTLALTLVVGQGLSAQNDTGAKPSEPGIVTAVPLAAPDEGETEDLARLCDG